MSATRRNPSSEGDRGAAEPLRELLSSLLGSAPAPEPELSDEELLAEIRKAAEPVETGDPE